ncbi:MAG: periplasmic heavy metal sensor [Nitrospiraceae bacterium]|nr:periplasmic heavy metal sensor [Nitrospiraceae bacterium]
MKKLLVVPFAVILFFGWSGYSNAMMMCEKSTAMSGMHMMPGRMMMDRLGPLGLDEKQTEEVKAIFFRTMKEGIKKKADMGVAEIELRELFLKEPADFKAVEAKVRQIEMLRGDIVILRLKAHEEIRSKLTAEQRKKFDSLMASPMPGMMSGKGGGMMPGRGFSGGMGDRGMEKCCRGRMMGGTGMMEGGMMHMQSDEDSPLSTDDMGQDAAGNDMPQTDMDHQQMQH